MWLIYLEKCLRPANSGYHAGVNGAMVALKHCIQLIYLESCLRPTDSGYHFGINMVVLKHCIRSIIASVNLLDTPCKVLFSLYVMEHSQELTPYLFQDYVALYLEIVA